MPAASVALNDQKQTKPPSASKLRITGKLKAALDLMVWQGKQWNEAAREVDFSTSAMIKAIRRPHVLAYLRTERQMLRESISAGNIHRLREIRDAADNMPAIQAIRTLEQMGDDQPASAAGASASPGITIRIVNMAQPGQADAHQPVMKDVTPPRALLPDDG